MKKKTLAKFEESIFDKSKLFNTMANKLFGGDTSSNGHTTASTGNDCDTATSDADDDTNPIKQTT